MSKEENKITIRSDRKTDYTFMYKGEEVTLKAGSVVSIADVLKNVFFPTVAMKIMYNLIAPGKEIIMNGIEIIGESAFKGCINLKEIKLPDSLKIIKDSAFETCSSLELIEIPSSVISMGSRAFAQCSMAKTIIVGSGLSYIADEAFYGCNSLKNILIPSSVTKIGESVLNYSVETVFYTGTQAMWKQIEMHETNYVLKNAEVEFEYIFSK